MKKNHSFITKVKREAKRTENLDPCPGHRSNSVRKADHRAVSG